VGVFFSALEAASTFLLAREEYILLWFSFLSSFFGFDE
jgi:hypothetical protein